jgi:hypothetical protein
LYPGFVVFFAERVFFGQNLFIAHFGDDVADLMPALSAALPLVTIST